MKIIYVISFATAACAAVGYFTWLFWPTLREDLEIKPTIENFKIQGNTFDGPASIKIFTAPDKHKVGNND
jgi:hypothetical protein